MRIHPALLEPPMPGAVGASRIPVSQCRGVLLFPWADLPAAAGSILTIPEQGQPLGRGSCWHVPGPDNLQLSCNSHTPSSCSSPAWEGFFLLLCFLKNEIIFLLSAAFYPFVKSVDKAFPSPKRFLLPSFPCCLAVLGIPDHHFQVRTSQSSPSSVSSASPTQRRPNLETRGWMYKSQTITPFCALLHQPVPPCESRVSGRQQAPDRHHFPTQA